MPSVLDRPLTDVVPGFEPVAALLLGARLLPPELTDADWDRLFAAGQRHDLAPLLHGLLKDSQIGPPLDVSERLRDAYFTTAALNARLFHERDAILRALRAQGIDAAVLKGASLAEAVHGNVALRPMGDLDLWVRRGQLDAARAAIEALGYEARSKADRPQALQDALTGETQLVKGGDILVELHWNVFPGEWVRHTARVDEDAVWARTVPLPGTEARQLAPEDAVIHSCVHLAVNHQMSGLALRTLLDLHLMREAWSIDWPALAERARGWRVSCAVWLVLQALGAAFGDDEHQFPLARLAPGPFRRFVLRRLVSLKALVDGRDYSSGPVRFLLLLLLVDRLRDAALLAWRGVFPDRLWLTLRYDEPDASPGRVRALRARHLWRLATTREP